MSTTLLSLAKQHRIKRKYLRMAALYRRCTRPARMDFSFAALLEMYRFESLGGQKPPTTNGYMAGKHFLDITVTDVKAELAEGTACKHEFYNSATGWFWKTQLERVIAYPIHNVFNASTQEEQRAKD